MIIKTRNTLAESAPVTRLTHTEAAGTNVIRWQNPNGFATSWGVQIGATGHEQTEVKVLSTGNPSGGTAGTLTANTLYEHPVDTPVYAIKYDQIVFERSTAGTAGTASPLANGTVTIQADQLYTQFDDTSGSATYAYKTYFRSSILAVNSTESDWFTPAGFDFYSLVKLRQRAKNKLWNADWLTDEVLDEWINECKDRMVNKTIQTNEDYALGTTNVGFGTDGLGTVTTTDFNQIRRVWVIYDGNNKCPSTKMNINDFLPDQSFSSSNPYHAWRGDSVFQIKPSDSAGTAELVFYRLGTTLVNDTDILPLPMRPFTHIFVDYCYAQALNKDEKFTEANNKMVLIEKDMDEFVTSLSPRDKSGPTTVDLVEPITGEGGII